MAQYDNNNQGVLYVNKDRQKDTHPNHRGKAQVGGLWYWVSSWTKESKQAGQSKFQSLAFTLMTQDEVDKYCQPQQQQPQGQQQQQQRPQQQTQQSAPANQSAANPPAGHPASEPPMDFDDDIPF